MLENLIANEQRSYSGTLIILLNNKTRAMILSSYLF